jgi:hypothetical protein
MQRSSIASRRVWFRVVCVLIGVHAMGTAFALRASSFSANLSVSVVFPSIAGLPANTSVNGGAAAMLPPCVVTATPPGTGMCTNPTDTRLSPPQGTTTVTFTAGPISGTAPPGGSVSAVSMGTSEETLIGNLNPFAVAFPLMLSYTATLNVAAGPLEFATASYTFNVTANKVGIFAGGAPNTFTLNCAACGAMTATNPVPLPPNQSW